MRIEADDDEGRELLLRYCARPCFALERLSVLPDGRVAYRVKYAGRSGTHRIMTPVEFLARLAALVPVKANTPVFLFVDGYDNQSYSSGVFNLVLTLQ